MSGSFTCHCDNTVVEWTLNENQHTKITLEKKILSPLLPGFELAAFLCYRKTRFRRFTEERYRISFEQKKNKKQTNKQKTNNINNNTKNKQTYCSKNQLGIKIAADLLSSHVWKDKTLVYKHLQVQCSLLESTALKLTPRLRRGDSLSSGSWLGLKHQLTN